MSCEQPLRSESECRRAPYLAVIDDDPLFLQALAANLSGGGYRVATFTSTKGILAGWFEGLRPDAVLAEARTATRDSAALPRALRSAGYRGPLVLMTPEEPRSSESGTDWITKTLPPTVFIRQLDRLLGRLAPAGDRLAIGSLVIDLREKQVIWRKCALALSRSEFEIVAVLAQQAGVTVAYREIFRAIQSDLFAAAGPGESYRMFVRAAVERLRQKILRTDPNFALIEHHAGLGYRWRL